jgi:hypothetical protein
MIGNPDANANQVYIYKTNKQYATPLRHNTFTTQHIAHQLLPLPEEKGKADDTVSFSS